MRNQPPQPMSGRRAAKPPTPAATATDATATEQPTPAERPRTPVAPSSSTTPAAPSSSTTPAAPSSSTTPAAPTDRPRMVVLFLAQHEYDLLERAADTEGRDASEWIQDSLCELAEARIAFENRQYERDQDDGDQGDNSDIPE